MRFIKYIAEGFAFFIIVIILFNMLSQFLQTVNLFVSEDVRYIGMVSVLLALNNLLTKSFFGYTIINQ